MVLREDVFAPEPTYKKWVAQIPLTSLQPARGIRTRSKWVSSSSAIKRGASECLHFLQPYQMSSSSNSYTQFSRGTTSLFDGEIRFCHCGHRVALKNSRTQRNNGRRFLDCALYGIQPACGFFEWVDGEIELVPKLLDMIDVLERDLKSACRRERCYLRVLLGTWAGIVFVVFICFLLISWTPVNVLELP